MISDWQRYFLPAIRRVLRGQNPYDVSGFYSPPWLLLILLPLAWAPWWIAITFPLITLTVTAHHKKKPWLIPIVAFSFPFITLSAYANVEWLPMIGLTFGGGLGPLLATVKPQATGFALVAYLRKGKLEWFMPLAVALVISFVIWPDWVSSMLAGGEITGTERNLSLFPYTIPLGLVALYLTWKLGDELWGVVATLSLTPYFYVPSLVPLLFLVADRDWRLGSLASLATWLLVWASMTGRIAVQF